ncbi:MAG: Nif3-like dinuclear metal center hexameric protein [Enterobacterales bacterium]
MLNTELELIINNKLNNNKINDFAPNGLQIEGRNEVQCILTGVSICQELINFAIEKYFDAIIVHHGIFWNNEEMVIRGIKKTRIKSILDNNINVYAWHLPLDINNKLGNNIKLAKKLNINLISIIENILLYGNFTNAISGEELYLKLKHIFNKNILYFNKNAPKKIKNIVLCTGSGQKFINLMYKYNVDAFITGEVSEQTFHAAKEIGIHFYAAGHHATEIYGIKSLGKWLSEKYFFNVTFLNVYNPA